MRTAMLLACALLTSCAAQADEPTVAESNADEVSATQKLLALLSSEDWKFSKQAYRDFADCAGLNEARSIYMAQLNDEMDATVEAMSKTLHETYMGARVVASWFLANAWYLRTGKLEPLRVYAVQVDDIAKASKKYYLFRLDLSGAFGIQEPQDECDRLYLLQAYVLDYLREQAIISDE